MFQNVIVFFFLKQNISLNAVGLTEGRGLVLIKTGVCGFLGPCSLYLGHADTSQLHIWSLMSEM